MQESSQPTTFLKAEVLDAALAEELRASGNEKPSLPDRAERLGIPYTTYWRQVAPPTNRRRAAKRFKASPELIAAVQIHFGEERFFEFFEFRRVELVAA